MDVCKKIAMGERKPENISNGDQWKGMEKHGKRIVSMEQTDKQRHRQSKKQKYKKKNEKTLELGRKPESLFPSAVQTDFSSSNICLYFFNILLSFKKKIF